MRFMNNEKIYVKMLSKFPAHAEKLPVMPYLEAGDYSTAVENAHTLKGLTGNLSLTPLYEAYDEIVKALRANEPEKAQARLTEVLPVQQAIIDCLNCNQ